jgi:hypothetical protein
MSRADFPQLPITGPQSASPSGTAARVMRSAVPGLLLLALAACSAGPMGGAGDNAVGPSGAAARGNTDLAIQQACRQRVNEMYEVRNRGDIYSSNPSVNTPFSANYQSDVPSRGLSNQFAYDQSLAECEHNAANGAEGPTVAPPAAPPVAKKGR